ncbi:hypothetical protein [Methylomonas sp. AM2-LC]|uniref:hypothetical protein n=1 Tax=Methylomonas sp. AM2-LC TaxID=3153301 RepID=UPI0032675228
MHTTINKLTTINLEFHHRDAWQRVFEAFGQSWEHDKPIPFSSILKVADPEATIFCMRAAPEYSKEWRLFAVWCARRYEHLINDMRGISAINVAERYAHGMASEEELIAAYCNADLAYFYSGADAAYGVAHKDAWRAAEVASASARSGSALWAGSEIASIVPRKKEMLAQFEYLKGVFESSTVPLFGEKIEEQKIAGTLGLYATLYDNTVNIKNRGISKSMFIGRTIFAVKFNGEWHIVRQWNTGLNFAKKQLSELIVVSDISELPIFPEKIQYGLTGSAPRSFCQ